MIFIYLVLAAQFESFIDPLLIMLSVPFSITGGIFCLYILKSFFFLLDNLVFGIC
ncbi:MAG: efflux RND transporter permease subunit [Hymenobacter sp.]|nr:MAG: efflux RND transporter permease subunit [Hymenobacter sp.]